MAKKVIGAEIDPRCAYCEYCVPTENKGTALCKKRGLTTLNSSCRKFSYDPLKRVPQRPAPLPEFGEDDFTL